MLQVSGLKKKIMKSRKIKHTMDGEWEDEDLHKTKPTIKMGDVNKDGEIDIFDLGDVKMHCLKIKVLQGDAFVAGDINKDGEIDIFDLGDIKMDILEIKKIA